MAAERGRWLDENSVPIYGKRSPAVGGLLWFRLAVVERVAQLVPRSQSKRSSRQPNPDSCALDDVHLTDDGLLGAISGGLDRNSRHGELAAPKNQLLGYPRWR
jgi:hypothetical protein